MAVIYNSYSLSLSSSLFVNVKSLRIDKTSSSLVPFWTAFNAKKSYIENNQETINNFRKSINKGLEYTLNNDAKTLANDIINLFPDTSLNDLEIIINRYKENDSWLDSTFITEKSFTNLEDMLITHSLIKDYVSYQDLIINE